MNSLSGRDGESCHFSALCQICRRICKGTAICKDNNKGLWAFDDQPQKRLLLRSQRQTREQVVRAAEKGMSMQMETDWSKEISILKRRKIYHLQEVKFTTGLLPKNGLRRKKKQKLQDTGIVEIALYYIERTKDFHPKFVRFNYHRNHRRNSVSPM
jgi:hypothetical protein